MKGIFMENKAQTSKVTKTQPALVRPSSLMSEFHREFDDMVKSFFEDRWPTNVWKEQRTSHFPQLSVMEKGNEYNIEVDLPGVEEKDIEVTLQDNALTLKGERNIEEETKEKNYHKLERSHGQFLRTVNFPIKVDSESINAELKNGVLKISVQKAKEALKQSKKVEIKCC